MMFGEVQNKILAKILKAEGLRYSEAYPGEEIDDDLYNYHLQQLVKNGLLEKVEGKYQLTSLGSSEVQMMDARGEIMEPFRVSVLMYVTQNEGKEILMNRRTRWPLRGDVVCPSGKIKRGEPIVEAAKRKLKEETGLMADFKLMGTLRSARKFKDKLVEDTVYFACMANKFEGELMDKSEFGEFFFTDFETAINYSTTNVGGSEAQREILKRVRDGNVELFNFDEFLELSKY